MAHANAAVLTAGSAVACTVLAFALGASAVGVSLGDRASAGPQSLWHAAAAGLALGVAFGLREQSIVQAAVLPSSGLPHLRMLARGFSRRWGWPSWLPSADRFIGWRDVGFFLAWIVALGPAAVAAAVAGWTGIGVSS
jgi:hypothetical protein